MQLHCIYKLKDNSNIKSIVVKQMDFILLDDFPINVCNNSTICYCKEINPETLEFTGSILGSFVADDKFLKENYELYMDTLAINNRLYEISKNDAVESIHLIAKNNDTNETFKVVCLDLSDEGQIVTAHIKDKQNEVTKIYPDVNYGDNFVFYFDNQK